MKHMPNKNEQTHILITGASRGLGAALALAYAKHYSEQANETLHLSLLATTTDNLNATKQQCTPYCDQIDCYGVDLNDPSASIASIQAIAEQPVDIAILNAGVTNDSKNNQETWQQQHAIINTNLLAAMACTHALIPSMQARQSGRIVLVSSIAAFKGLGLTPSYCASKAGIKAYADSIRGGLADQGVTVHCVMPGFIATDMTAAYSGATPFMISSERAAMIVIKGLQKNRLIIIFPRLISWGMRLLNILPVRWSDAILKYAGYGSPTQ